LSSGQESFLGLDYGKSHSTGVTDVQEVGPRLIRGLGKEVLKLWKVTNSPERVDNCGRSILARDD